MQGLKRLATWIGLVFVWAALPALAQTAATAPENTGPNTSILRWAEGKYIYLGDNGKRERGTENFRLNVHPDGTRTLIMWHDLYARNVQYTVVLRVADNFRPLQAFTNYWSENGYKGSAVVTVNGDTLETVSHGPLGTFTQTIAVPETFSLGTHPVSGDGWHMWYDDPKAKGPQKTGMLYGMESGGDMTKPVLGVLHPIEFERIGPEKITVPAGTFDTIKYRLSGVSDVWVTMPDRTLIRMSNTMRGIDYLLTDYKSGDNTKTK